MFDQMTNSSLQEECRQSFTEIIEKGEKKGIEWSKANFVSYKSDSLADVETKMDKLKGKIYFKIENAEYFLSFDEIF